MTKFVLEECQWYSCFKKQQRGDLVYAKKKSLIGWGIIELDEIKINHERTQDSSIGNLSCSVGEHSPY